MFLKQDKRLHTSQEKGHQRVTFVCLKSSCFQHLIFILASGKTNNKPGQSPVTFSTPLKLRNWFQVSPADLA